MGWRVNAFLVRLPLLLSLAACLFASVLCIISHYRYCTWVRLGPSTWRVELLSGHATISRERIDLRRVLNPDDRCFPQAFHDERSERAPWPRQGWVRTPGLPPDVESARNPLAVSIDWRNGYLGPTNVIWAGRNPILDTDAVPFTFDRREAQLPLAGVALLALVPALAVVLSKLARRSRPHGFCSMCGYDLRASEGRCPECGLAIAQTALAERNRGFSRLAVPVVVAFLMFLVASLVFASSSRHATLVSAQYGSGDLLWANADFPIALPTGQLVLRLEGGVLVTGFGGYPLVGLSSAISPPLTGLRWLEPGYQRPNRGGVTAHLLQIPVWMFVVAMLAIVVVWIRRVRRLGGFWLAWGRLPRAATVGVGESTKPATSY